MKIIGITGGVGSGKSRVLSFLKEIDQEGTTEICQADHVAWELQEIGQTCYKKILAHFGEGILNENFTINRKALGQIVFQDEKELQILNQITHPVVKQEILKRIENAKKSGKKLFFLEAALLIEEHYDEICDELWYIYTDEQIRRQRLMTARGYSEEKIDSIMAAQLPEAVFREKCSCVIENNGDFDLTQRQLLIEAERKFR